MKKKLLTGMILSVIMTLSWVPYAKAVNFKTKPNSQGTMILSKTDQSNLATFITDCEITELDLNATKNFLNKCRDETCNVEIWQTPLGVVSIGFGSLIIGALLANKL